MCYVAPQGTCHSFHGEESRQVSRVGGDQDEGEEPPRASNDPTGNGPFKRTHRQLPVAQRFFKP